LLARSRPPARSCLARSLSRFPPPPPTVRPPHAPLVPPRTPSQTTTHPFPGHCKRLAPVWEELATALKAEAAADPAAAAEPGAPPGVFVAHVDCTTDKAVCAAQGIKGYPTLKLVHRGEAVESYKGARDLETLKAFAVEKHRELTSET